MKTKTLPIVLAGIACLAMVGGGWWWHGADGRLATVAASLPPVPDLAAVSDSLREQIATADARAHSHWRASAGLAELSRLYQANGFLDEAMRCYEGLEQLEPEEPRWPHRHASILAGFGEIEPAARLWRRVTELAPDYVPARLRLGDCELKANRLDAGAAIYTDVLRLNPGNAYALLGLARVDYETGRWDKAKERLETLVAQTNYQLGYDLIVSVYERLGQMDRAAAIRGVAKASGAYRDPADPWLDELMEVCFDSYRLSLAAGTLARSGELVTALRLQRRAVELAPEDIAARFQLGNLYAQQGEFRVAREQFERCTKLAPDFSDGWVRLSDLQAEAGEDAAAEFTVESGLRHCPQSPGLHQMRARFRRKAGRTDEAIADYLISINLRPTEPDAYFELGNLYIELGREKEGLEKIQNMLVAEPADPRALCVLAIQAIITGDKATANQWLARVADQPRVPREQFARLQAAYRQKFGRDWAQVR